ncbi:hypothetical protein MMC14_010546 [Varicellaria rhodocarpa]|nr:hypothetical protein [Varicellaria rhodocarpa]
MFVADVTLAFVLLLCSSLVTAIPIFEKRATSANQSDFDELQRAAELSSAAYSDCQGSAFGLNITLQINNLGTDTQGFVGYDTSKQRISVVMRGSTTVQDILNDINILPVIPVLSGVSFPLGTLVMAGLYLPWLSVHDQVIAEVTSLIAQFPTYTLETTGHSLGGSLTYLSYISLAQNFPGIPITSNALAAFPIGNSIFAAFGTAQGGLLRRGNNANDGVPNMYPSYTHYGVEFFGSGTAPSTLQCSGQRDPACSAGDGQFTVSLGHFSSFGINMAFDGCGT